MNVAGIHETSDISSKRLRVKIGDHDGKVKEDNMAYSDPNVIAGNRTYNFKKLKRNISSPVSFERLNHQPERCQSHLRPRLLSSA